VIPLSLATGPLAPPSQGLGSEHLSWLFMDDLQLHIVLFPAYQNYYPIFHFILFPSFLWTCYVALTLFFVSFGLNIFGRTLELGGSLHLRSYLRTFHRLGLLSVDDKIVCEGLKLYIPNWSFYYELRLLTIHDIGNIQ